MTNAIKTMGLSELVIKLHELRIQLAESPENENLNEDIAYTETDILRELPYLYNETTDDILSEAISKLILADDDHAESVTNLSETGSETTEEEYEQLLKKVDFTGDLLEKAWCSFIESYADYIIAKYEWIASADDEK